MDLETTVQLVQRQLDAFNAGDVEAFLACYGETAQVEALGGELIVEGREAMAEHYRALFAGNPQVRASLLDRISVGDWVIDEELIDGMADGHTLHAAAIYRVVDGRIASVRIAR